MAHSGEQPHNDTPMVAVESHRSVPAPFLIKAYQLVDDSKTDDLISWNETGTTFIVWRPAEFARDLLPNYFKHNNFSSFVRQLNTYSPSNARVNRRAISVLIALQGGLKGVLFLSVSVAMEIGHLHLEKTGQNHVRKLIEIRLGFRKIVPDRWEFSNEFFRKGEKHLLCEIHRRKGLIQPPPPPENRPISPSNSTEEQTWSSTSSPSSSPTLEALNHKNALEENEKLKRDNCQLLTELAQTKKLCNHLLFLCRHVNITPDVVTSFLSQNIGSAERLSMLSRLKDYLDQQGGEENSRDHYPSSSLSSGLPLVNDGRLIAGPGKECIASNKVPFVDGVCRELGRKTLHSVKLEDDDDEKGSPKLFGVSLVSKKRPLPVSSNNGQPEPLVCKIGRCTN